MNYAEMEAGPEMDRLVAEKVMGWRDMSWAERYPNDAEDTGFMPRQWYGPLPDGRLVGLYNVSEHDHDSPNSLWRPSVNIAHAWEVVERLAALGHTVSIGVPPEQHKGTVRCDVLLCGDGSRFNAPILRGGYVIADTAPLAICRASLRAMGVDHGS